jgi:membrane protein
MSSHAPRERSDERSRGREANEPKEIPKAGWRDIFVRVKEAMARERLSIIAAGVAFYALLAALPALTALVSVYGMVFDQDQAMDQISALSGLIPGEAVGLLSGQLKELARADHKALGLGAAGGLLLALWSASAAVRTLMAALNVAYHEQEKRGWLKRTALSLLLTLVAITGGIVALSAIVVVPAAINLLGFGAGPQGIAYYARWPILALTYWFGLMVMYRYGPSRDRPRWSWVTWGSLAVTLLWVVGSVLFSWYVEHFGNFNKTYGSLGAVVILLMWLLLSSYAALIGAKINAESERQTRKDSTVGEPRPLGQRHAHAADTVGRAAGS